MLHRSGAGLDRLAVEMAAEIGDVHRAVAAATDPAGPGGPEVVPATG